MNRLDTCLVTGAAGFIGAAVAKRLITEGHKVVTIDNLSTGYRDHIPDQVTFINANCFENEVLTNILSTTNC